MNVSPSDTLNVKRQEQIALPSPKHEKRMAIRYSDWERVRRNLATALKPVPKLTEAYYFLFGFAGSAFLSLLPLLYAEKLPAWVNPLFFLIFIFSLACGIIFVSLEKKLKGTSISNLDSIMTDMAEIEKVFSQEVDEKV